MYVKINRPIPFTHCRVREVSIPNILPSSVIEVSYDPASALPSCEDSLRTMLLGTGVTITTQHGHRFWLLQDQVALALAGGGHFIEILPNSLYDQPMTREQWEEEQHEAEMAAVSG
jgi:hypothetical protein